MSTVLDQDKITLRNFHTTAIFGLDAWSRPSRPQPVTLSISLGRSTANAGISDDIGYTFSYGTMCKDVQKRVEGREFKDVDALVWNVIDTAFEWPGETLEIEAVAPTALLRCEGGLGVSTRYLKCGDASESSRVTANAEIGPWVMDTKEWSVQGLKCACIIGVNPPERKDKQDVLIELHSTLDSKVGNHHIDMPPEKPIEEDAHGFWQDIVRRVCDVTEASSFQTLEALAALIAKTCLEVDQALLRIMVKIEKPSALTFVDGAGVEITRDRNWLHDMYSNSDGNNKTSSND